MSRDCLPSDIFAEGPRRACSAPSLPRGHPFTAHASHSSTHGSIPHHFWLPLFSYSYELLFPQFLYFDNHPHCPRVPLSTSPTFKPSGVEMFPNPFPCHTYEKCVRNPSICHTSKIAALQVLCLPHIRKRWGCPPVSANRKRLRYNVGPACSTLFVRAAHSSPDSHNRHG